MNAVDGVEGAEQRRQVLGCEAAAVDVERP